MSALGILALLSAAAEALPNGTPAERAAWCKAKEREYSARPAGVILEDASGDITKLSQSLRKRRWQQKHARSNQ